MTLDWVFFRIVKKSYHPNLLFIQDGGKSAVTPSFDVEDLAWFLDHLSGLRSFLDANASLSGTSPASGDATWLQDAAGDASFMFSHGGSASRLVVMTT